MIFRVAAFIILIFLIFGMITFCTSRSVNADVFTVMTLPVERTDNTPIHCEISTVSASLSGNCARYKVTDLDGRESLYSTESCGGCSADLNLDGVVNYADLAIFRQQFFKTSCN